jgi:hypothetical protein
MNLAFDMNQLPGDRNLDDGRMPNADSEGAAHPQSGRIAAKFDAIRHAMRAPS